MATLFGTNANDILIGRLGNDLIEGNDGDDLIISRSDAGEPDMAQDPNAAKIYPDQPYNDANDTLSGGNGADTFLFNPLINAKTSMIAKHVDAKTGDINWGMNGVGGENNNTHDHWVDSIGNDVILDYNQAEGDVISINGHTTEVANIQYVDVDGDGKEESIIQLISNQGGAGAHDGDLLGTITVFGDLITEADLVVQKSDLGALQFDDVIVGSSDNDKLYGDTGNDTLDGGNGDDTLNGGSGDDSLRGGLGSDLLKGKGGHDILNGNQNDDTLYGGSGDDSLYGGIGNDVLEGDNVNAEQGNDFLNGGDGHDYLHGKAGHDTLKGGQGDDTLYGGLDSDSLYGGMDDDLLDGQGGHDFLNGGEGADTLYGNKGNDTLLGSDGNDSLYGEAAQDSLDGGNGDDFLSGGDSHDFLQGAAGADNLQGDKGNDTLDGGEGNDTLNGGQGNDTLMGGDNNDVLLSRSDVGEPDIAQDSNATKIYPNQPYNRANDLLSGGLGADTFRFELLLNAKDEIAAKHADPLTGVVNWQAVAGENNNIHDHWVDAIGHDVILDYNQAEGDNIEIFGHTVEATVSHIDSDNNGSIDYSLIELISNQGGTGSHDGDLLGSIAVYGDIVNQSDLMVDKTVFYGAYEYISAV